MGIFWILFIVVSIVGIAVCRIFKFIAEIVVFAIVVLILLFALLFFGLSRENKTDKDNEPPLEEKPESRISRDPANNTPKKPFAPLGFPANKRRAARVNAKYQKEKKNRSTTPARPRCRCRITVALRQKPSNVSSRNI
ncbi:hypothetical protein OZX74_01335 [Bifidobacterium sp. ESL0798]|uniref:hypothetical protein n=1 Tax=Bifidobacterium sp. ESL0798 TaxID=2983235 RepID=UPI0023F6BD95|nr:hypothetical protein [Bifidobacterium sp. ESL0798]WEV74236.1 hypothetical protein OZX74_01335 [Bifidobacterium sp. ESL0798]